MFRRHKSSDLPMSTRSSVEGSGKSVRMDAPFVRSIKNFSFYIKFSYVWFFVSLLMTMIGWRHISYNNAFTYLQCHFSGCTLQIKYPGEPAFKTKVHRKQLIRTDHVRVTSDGTVMGSVEDLKKRPPQPEEKKTKKKKKRPYGEDSSDGLYDSYTLVLREYDHNSMGFMDEEGEDGTYNTLQLERTLHGIGIDPGPVGEYTIVMRKFNLNKRRGSARGQHTRLKSYIMARRNKLTVREDRGPTWQGVLLLVFGIFSCLLSVLLGQFWVEEDKRFVSRGGRKASGRVAVKGRSGQAVQKRF